MNVDRRSFIKTSTALLGSGMLLGTDVIPDEITKRVLNIPDRYTRVCITPLGIPVEWPDSLPKKKLSEFIAYESL